MTIIHEIIAPKENADDCLLVNKRYYATCDKVSANDELMDLETSKVEVTIDTPVEGYVEYLVEAGDTVDVGDIIIRIHDEPESIVRKDKSENKIKGSVVTKFVSKKARDFISSNNMDVTCIDKTFISLHDVDPEARTRKKIKDYNHTEYKNRLETRNYPVSFAKKAEIRALSAVQTAGFVSTIFCNVDAFTLPDNDKLLFSSSGTYLPLIAYETSQLLKKYPLLNAYFDDNMIKEYVNINIGIALDIDDGLKVYTIENSDRLTAEELQQAISEGIYSYFRKSLTPDKIRGSTFTITDLSSFGVDRFVPLINGQQSAILGISSVDRKLDRFTLSLSFDHRVTEGKVASQFLSELASQVEKYA